ncbi:ImmA/IrrE family metallo-endopeptidase [Telmatospirillum sp.]|uniref:ImmA/IrrE family metallo-endopeptidase n=1 Tax=Telmatospirillum sp. TaxID=2079197 RepID=UPI002850D01E|nr:ImmA/IrrE family metallo-endopeptidase [Telmatospirillum sp.]MDR3437166.1 ImmA/IrrE family metallo-endopeptidase [Telmatospirillum sp.]
MAKKSEIQIVARHMLDAPVDIRAIFDDLGVRYEEIQMSTQSGWITRNGDTFTVSVNGLESATRRRFTAAHELAHYLLHRDLMGDGNRMHRHIDTLYAGGGQSGDVIFKRSHEIEANRIAAQIVMPKKLVEQEHALTPDAGELAAKFGVSKPAMEIRLKTLGLRSGDSLPISRT